MPVGTARLITQHEGGAKLSNELRQPLSLLPDVPRGQRIGDVVGGSTRLRRGNPLHTGVHPGSGPVTTGGDRELVKEVPLAHAEHGQRIGPLLHPERSDGVGTFELR